MAGDASLAPKSCVLAGQNKERETLEDTKIIPVGQNNKNWIQGLPTGGMSR